MGGVAQRLAGAILVSVVLTVVVYGFTYGGPVAAPLGVGLGIFLIAGSINEINHSIIQRWRRVRSMHAQGARLATLDLGHCHRPCGMWASW